MNNKHKPYGLYEKCFKRWIDVLCCIAVLLVLWWIYVIVVILVRVKLGSPVLFTQERPGKNEKIFKLYKFRTMTDKRDENGNLLPDNIRLTKFGKALRATSLDELPEVFNILKGDMSIVGPRPLLVKYLPFYNDLERHRHDVRPGLTGYAQVHGRNTVNWEERFMMDADYAANVTFIGDIRILIDTVMVVLKHEGVVLQGLEDFDVYRKKQGQSNTVDVGGK